VAKAKFVAIQNIKRPKMMEYKNEELKRNVEMTK